MNTINIPESSRLTVYLNIHKCRIKFTTNSQLLKEDFLADFRFFEDESHDPPDLSVFLICDKQATFTPPQNAIVHNGPNDTFFFKDKHLYIKANYGKAYGEVNTEERKIIVRGDEILAYFLLKNILTSFLSVLLEQKGIFRIHGAALAKNSKGAVFANVSSGGKTTICYHLSNGGFQYLSDDVAFISFVEGKPRLLAYPTRLGVDKKMLVTCHLPDSTYRSVVEGTREKWLVPASDLFSERIIEECDLAFLAIITLWTGQETKIKEIASKDVISKLVPHIRYSPFHQISTLENHSRKRFLTALDISRSVRCYNVYIGTNPTHLVKAIKGLF